MNIIEHVPILAYRDKSMQQMNKLVMQEQTLNIYLNSRRIAELICSPCDLHELVLGFLFSEGYIDSVDDLTNIAFLNKENCIVDAPMRIGKNESNSKQASRENMREHSKKLLCAVPSEARFNIEQIINNLTLFFNESTTNKRIPGVHRASLCTDDKMLLSANDIGRHNAIDKVLGMAMLHQINLKHTYLITSGRVPSDLVIKSIRAQIQMLISRSIPSKTAIDIAAGYNLTLIGCAQEDRFNVYCGEQRLVQCADVTI